MIDKADDLKAKQNLFVSDRAGTSGEAVRVNGKSTYLTAPVIDYYINDFTVTGWVKFNENLPNQAFLDFSVNHVRENTWRFFLKEKTMTPFFEINNEFVNSNNVLLEKKWYHLTFAVEGVQANMYVNGRIVAGKELKTAPVYVSRNLGNYIGRSHMAQRNVSNADFDEIKIFNRGLLDEEVWKEMMGENSISEI
jgi:hypothetical protein